ncbi:MULTISPECIES: ATP synthase subunit I [Colwellia]|uniref:ATP synthase protein I n=1 Tax=Colwellia psychrerythraea (strain 34H / ATCC BAA-681) TaxID=167879 RepID=Q48AX8_COLP3|nr:MULTISPECIES: ATP synthase subunit I [Colwellia]AAZ24306.1 ATP synthase protein I [Colwellia psychrerythraea 34H]PKH88215.1 F0F1 ATP synthase assembly protein I [Colwellia sp. Bg11-28]
MRNELTKPGRKFAYQQSALITLITLIFTLITYFIWGFESAKSAALGGIIGILPNLFFAYKAFRFAGARASKMVVESFFSGVKQKMALMALLLGLTIKFVVISPLPFFSMFCLVMALPIITPFIIKQQR